jgi:hypothetical protein
MGLDSFFGTEDADGGMSAEKVREFQERMRKNAKQMAAAKKQEAKQKKKEDKLVAILVRFIKNNTRTDITLLVSRCLEQNIPAVLILAIILLGNEAIQKELGIEFELMESEEVKDTNKEINALLEEGDEDSEPTTLEELEDDEMKGAMVVFGKDESFPLKIRIAIDLWGKNIWESISPIPERVLKTAVEFNEDPQALPIPKDVMTQLTAFILRDYFEQHQFTQKYENLKSFATFFMKGLMKRLKDQVKDQKQLGGNE